MNDEAPAVWWSAGADEVYQASATGFGYTAMAGHTSRMKLPADAVRLVAAAVPEARAELGEDEDGGAFFAALMAEHGACTCPSPYDEKYCWEDKLCGLCSQLPDGWECPTHTHDGYTKPDVAAVPEAGAGEPFDQNLLCLLADSEDSYGPYGPGPLDSESEPIAEPLEPDWAGARLTRDGILRHLAERIDDASGLCVTRSHRDRIRAIAADLRELIEGAAVPEAGAERSEECAQQIGITDFCTLTQGHDGSCGHPEGSEWQRGYDEAWQHTRHDYAALSGLLRGMARRAGSLRFELADVLGSICWTCSGTGIAAEEVFGRDADGAPMADGVQPCPKGCEVPTWLLCEIDDPQDWIEEQLNERVDRVSRSPGGTAEPPAGSLRHYVGTMARRLGVFANNADLRTDADLERVGEAALARIEQLTEAAAPNSGLEVAPAEPSDEDIRSALLDAMYEHDVAVAISHGFTERFARRFSFPDRRLFYIDVLVPVVRRLLAAASSAAPDTEPREATS